jgi:TRAP-type mannitol/chloroaromatic compound transport system permease small subunit
MNKTATNGLKALHVVAWVLFVGLCIKAGAILVSFLVSVFVNPAGASNLYNGLNLSALMQYDTGHYQSVVLTVFFLTAAKAYVFYLAIKIFQKINLIEPFSEDVGKLINGIAYTTLSIGFLSIVGSSYAKWLNKRAGDDVIQGMFGESAEFLLLGAVIFMIATVFHRGIELQKENSLTI